MAKATDRSTEHKILAAARKVFLNKGMDGARMQDIADEAGINKALLHYYFRSKDQLFERIFLEVAATLLPRVFTVLESEATLFEKIERFCDAYISQLIRAPYVPIFVLNEINRQPEAFLQKVLAGRQPPLGRMLGQIEREVRAGIIRPIDPLELLLNILSLCIFPFVAAPLVRQVSGLSQRQFTALMEARKKEVPRLIIESIKA